jgi:hypothetical protein
VSACCCCCCCCAITTTRHIDEAGLHGPVKMAAAAPCCMRLGWSHGDQCERAVRVMCTAPTDLRWMWWGCGVKPPGCVLFWAHNESLWTLSISHPASHTSQSNAQRMDSWGGCAV